MKEGCPNCEAFLNLQGSSEAIDECTSQVFEGLITLADPAKSWVAKWQRLDSYVRGVYAVKVVGTVSRNMLSLEGWLLIRMQLPDDIIESMEREYKIKYIPYVARW